MGPLVVLVEDMRLRYFWLVVFYLEIKGWFSKFLLRAMLNYDFWPFYCLLKVLEKVSNIVLLAYSTFFFFPIFNIILTICNNKMIQKKL